VNAFVAVEPDGALAAAIVDAVPRTRRAEMDPGLLAIAGRGRSFTVADYIAAHTTRAELHNAISVPRGLAANGLPIDVQIVSPLGADQMVLRAAKTIENAMPMGRRPG